jgi:STAND-like protein
MTDPLSVTASILGVAGAGIKLATTLYTYSDAALTADRSVRTIANDISLTASVLSELGTLLEHDNADKLVSTRALETAGQTVTGCKEVFEEIDDAVGKMLGGAKRKEWKGKEPSAGGMSVWARMKWPLMEPRMRVLQANLERLKSTLLLMLNVITYARKLSSEYATCFLS